MIEGIMELYTKPVAVIKTADAYCVKCGNGMTGDEAALNFKYVNRKAKEFLCPKCLGERMGTTAEEMREMIVVFRKQGCRMFSPWVSPEN